MYIVGKMLKFREACWTQISGQKGKIGVLRFALAACFLADHNTGKEDDRQKGNLPFISVVFHLLLSISC